MLTRKDRFDRFVVGSRVCKPRERYDSAVHAAIGKYLVEAYHGRLSAFYPYYTEGPLVRIHYIIGRSGGDTPEIPRAQLEAAVADIVRTWTDKFDNAVTSSHVPTRAREITSHFHTAFSAAYREAYSPEVAVTDIKSIEGLSAERPLAVSFHRGNGGEEGTSAFSVELRQANSAIRARPRAGEHGLPHC